MITIAVVGFLFNHPTGIRNVGAFKVLSRQREIKIHIITVTDWDGYRNEELAKPDDSIQFHFLPPRYLSKKSIQFRYYMKGLYRKLKQIDPDIIYAVDEPVAMNSALALWSARRLHKKCIAFTWENFLISQRPIVN